MPFRTHDRLSFLGASPDGGVGESGLVEFKAPIYQVPCVWQLCMDQSSFLLFGFEQCAAASPAPHDWFLSLHGWIFVAHPYLVPAPRFSSTEIMYLRTTWPRFISALSIPHNIPLHSIPDTEYTSLIAAHAHTAICG